MIEAERFLEAKQNRGKNPVSPPDLPASPPARPRSASVRTETSPASRPLETKWLDFVNYILVPAGVLLSVIGLFMVGGKAGEMGAVVVGLVADIAVGVALFFGLRNRTPWGWWLMMAVLVMKAPMAAWNRYSLACMKADLMGQIRDMGYSVASGTRVDGGGFVWLAIAGFVFLCLPQMIYFYNRRGLFDV
jgi:hypothetical protein